MPTRIDALVSTVDPLDSFIVDCLTKAKQQGEALTIADLARRLELPVAGERHRLIGAVAIHALTQRIDVLVAAKKIERKSAHGEDFFWVAPPASPTPPTTKPTSPV
jgi:hypothetical protein